MQLFAAREGLAEARETNNKMEKSVAWLTASNSEERALRQKISGQMNGIKENLVRQRVAHSFAVKQYLQEMEER